MTRTIAPWRILACLVSAAALVLPLEAAGPASAASGSPAGHTARAAAISPPVSSGTLRIAGRLRDGSPVRAAREPHRLQGGELPGEPAALPCGQRPGDAKLPDRSWAVARDAARQGLPGQEARPGSAQRRGAHRRPGRAHRTGVPLARGP